MDTMQDIERATQAFAEARTTLATHVTELNDLINAAKREKLAAIRRAVARASEKQAALTELITDNRALFERPKTRVLHGVKVGYPSPFKRRLSWRFCTSAHDSARVMGKIAHAGIYVRSPRAV